MSIILNFEIIVFTFPVMIFASFRYSESLNLYKYDLSRTLLTFKPMCFILLFLNINDLSHYRQRQCTKLSKINFDPRLSTKLSKRNFDPSQCAKPPKINFDPRQATKQSKINFDQH